MELSITSVKGYQRRFLLRKTVIWLGYAAIAPLLVYLTVKPEGIFTVLAGLAALVVCVMALARPLHGLALLLAGTLIFEQYGIAGLNPLTYQVPFFTNINAFIPLKFFSATPAELLMITIAIGSIAEKIRKRTTLVRGTPPLSFHILAMVGVLVYGLLLGMTNGGQFNYGLWEVRALVYLCGMMILVPMVVQRRDHVQLITWALVIGLAFKSLQGVWRAAVSFGGNVRLVESIVSHEDALFFATGLILLVGWYAYGVKSRQRVLLLIFTPAIVLSFLAAQRRASFISLGLGLAVLAMILMKEKPRLVLSFLIPTAVLLPIYLAAFWNSESLIAQPVRAIRSSINPSGQRDMLSNRYRIAEKVNLQHNINNNPFTGLGFGRPYDVVAPMDKIDFPLWQYITHNAILWIWMKTGIFGFAVFWLFIGGIIVEGLIIARSADDPFLKAFAVFAVVFTCMQMITSYVDMQLTFYRNMIYLGVVLGTTLAISTINRPLTPKNESKTFTALH